LPVGSGIDAGNSLDGFLETGGMCSGTLLGLGLGLGLGLDLEDSIAVHHRHKWQFGRSKHNHTGLQTIQSQLTEQTETSSLSSTWNCGLPACPYEFCEAGWFG
jgi:hypothetical protein